jgi:imidazole glycerol-phosphate synthase subunit HisF
MLRTRVIPCLLLKNNGLVKTVSFADPKYVGDPINAVRIFNEMEVDELILLDIEASRQGKEPDYEIIKNIISEAFMPVTYGGGVRNVEQAQHLVSLGVEKVAVNTAALQSLDLVRDIVEQLGSSSTVVAVDVKKDWMGRYRVFDAKTGKITDRDPLTHIRQSVDAGAGEIFLNDVARDGTGKGYDLDLLRMITPNVSVPVISCGGAGNLEHFREAVDAGASAVAAGSMFVYVGKHRAVMINYPQQRILEGIFKHD